MIQDAEEPWEQKMYRIFFRCLMLVREAKRRPTLATLERLESTIEAELMLLEVYGTNKEDYDDEG